MNLFLAEAQDTMIKIGRKMLIVILMLFMRKILSYTNMGVIDALLSVDVNMNVLLTDIIYEIRNGGTSGVCTYISSCLLRKSSPYMLTLILFTSLCMKVKHVFIQENK